MSLIRLASRDGKRMKVMGCYLVSILNLSMKRTNVGVFCIFTAKKVEEIIWLRMCEFEIFRDNCSHGMNQIFVW